MDLKVISQDLSSFYAAKIEKYRLSENHIIDKMPFNLFWVGFLAISFPNAQFVHCKRDARATCWSNYETSFAEGNQFSYKLNEIVRHYNNCEDLKAKRFPIADGFLLPIMATLLFLKLFKLPL